MIYPPLFPYEIAAYAAQARRKAARVKPTIRRTFNVRGHYEWRCTDQSECFCIGWGATPEAAYEQWLARFAACRRSRAE